MAGHEHLSASIPALSISPPALQPALPQDGWLGYARAQVLALAMAQHPRLGVESPAAKLPTDCLARVFEKLLVRPVVLDVGTWACKAGLAGETSPRTIFPTVVGRPKMQLIFPGAKNVYVGHEARAKRGIVRLTYPVEHGIVTNWDTLEDVWRHAFMELGASCASQPLVLSEAPLNPKANRERMVQLAFDVFGVPAVYICLTSTLTLHAMNRTTGVVVSSGDSVTHVMPVYEGYALPHAARRLDMAGRDLTHRLARLMTERGYSFTANSEMNLVRDIKEKLVYVALDYEEEVHRNEIGLMSEGGQAGVAMARTYELPDGRLLTLGSECFRCAEALFDPGRNGLSGAGIHQIVFESIMHCDDAIHPQLYGGIVLSGGNSMISGFARRMSKEVSMLLPAEAEIQVIVPPGRADYAAWRGGSNLASSPDFQKMRLTREEYDSMGPNVIHQKCFS